MLQRFHVFSEAGGREPGILTRLINIFQSSRECGVVLASAYDQFAHYSLAFSYSGYNSIEIGNRAVNIIYDFFDSHSQSVKQPCNTV